MSHKRFGLDYGAIEKSTKCSFKHIKNQIDQKKELFSLKTVKVYEKSSRLCSKYQQN